jgi:tetratricopeptide (TPR) repeat protein
MRRKVVANMGTRIIMMMNRFSLGIAICFFLIFPLTVPVVKAAADGPYLLNDSTDELMRKGEYEKAVEQLRNAFSLFPYNESLRLNLTAAYAALGNRQLERKQFDAAAENFDNARNLAPDNQDYAVLRGIALYLGKRYDEAAIDLEQARLNGGDTVHLLVYLGRVYYDTGHLTKAVDSWDRALTLEPENKAIRELAAKARRESVVESPMEKGYSSMFVITYDGGTKPDLADAVLDVLETAYNRIGSDLAFYPVSRVPVILYTRKDYRNVTAGPDWSGGLYDGKIRLPIGGATEITPLLQGVLFHEYTHVVVAELTKGNCPTWLNEGLAEIEGRKEYDPPVTDLDKVAATSAFIPFKELEKSWSSLDNRSAALAYQQSYSIVKFMISAYGWHKVREILINLGSGKRIEAAIAAAFADYGLDYARIMDEWREHLRKAGN